MISKPPKERRKRHHKDSILQTEKECFVTGRTDNLHEHHIYFGRGQREISEASGFKVWLTGTKHNESNQGVHFNKEFDLYLKRICQEKFEETNSRAEFMQLIGRSYL